MIYIKIKRFLHVSSLEMNRDYKKIIPLKWNNFECGQLSHMSKTINVFNITLNNTDKQTFSSCKKEVEVKKNFFFKTHIDLYFVEIEFERNSKRDASVLRF